jgi:hypothetical protein
MAGMNLDFLLFSVRLATAPSRSLLLPWESGFGAVVFGRGELLPSARPVPKLTDPVPTVCVIAGEDLALTSIRNEVAAISSRPFKRLRGRAKGRDEKDLRLRAIHVRDWMNFTLLNPQASRAGRQLVSIADDSMRVATMEDILFDRITGTLAARSSALTMFTRWANSHGIPPNRVTPIQEELAYMYVCTLHSESPPAIRTSRFRETIMLALHILGMDDNAVALNSKRITGQLRLFGRKRFSLQRDPTSVEWVELMKSITLGDAACSFEDWLISGHSLWSGTRGVDIGICVRFDSLSLA